jgi:ribosomal protein S18 acetylase RimI-like enzyme
VEMRVAAPDDIAQISVLLEHSFAYNAAHQPSYYKEASEKGQYPRSVIGSVNGDIYIALDEEVVIGLIHVEERSTPPYETYIPHKYAEVVDLFVDPTYRGQGVGEALVSAAKKWAASRRLDYLELFVLSENDGGIRFYERMGFETVSHNMRLLLND